MNVDDKWQNVGKYQGIYEIVLIACNLLNYAKWFYSFIECNDCGLSTSSC